MTEFIVTFPIGDPERADCFARITALNEESARNRIIARYGRDFGSVYADDSVVQKYDLREIEFGA